MFTLKVENKKGEQLELTHNEEKYQVTNIEGLTPPDTEIYMMDNTSDGSLFNHQRTPSRNIVIYLVINGIAEKNRIELYKYFRNGEKITLYYKNDTRDVFIEGYVEKVTPIIFGNKEECQISILCPDPWFKSVEERVITTQSLVSNFYFQHYTTEPKPVSYYAQINDIVIENDGDIASGATFKITATENSLANVKIYNRSTDEVFALGTSEVFPDTEGGQIQFFGSAETLFITTYQNNKTIVRLLNGVEENFFYLLAEGSTFLQIQPGQNIISYTAGKLGYSEDFSTMYVIADEGTQYIDIEIRYRAYYRGV